MTQTHSYHQIVPTVFSFRACPNRFKKTKLFQHFHKSWQDQSRQRFVLLFIFLGENLFLGAQRIFLFLDRKTKDPTGDATVTFQSPESAKKAIDQFDQTDFNGHGMITVKQASPDQKNPFAEMLVSTFELGKIMK